MCGSTKTNDDDNESLWHSMYLSETMTKYLKIFCLGLMIACIIYIWVYSYSGSGGGGGGVRSDEIKMITTTEQLPSPTEDNKEKKPEECLPKNSFDYEKSSNNSIFKNQIDRRVLTFNQIEKKLSEMSITLLMGGRSYTQANSNNTNCTSSRNVAFIIPYRNRLESLKVFLSNMHPILTRQNINYGIYLIEPVNNVTFNRALLLNVGFVEVLKEQMTSVRDKLALERQSPNIVNDVVAAASSTDDNTFYNCFVFHDVDMLPEDSRLQYHCDSELPVQIAVAVQKFGYDTNGYFSRYTGGITSFTKQQFVKINGFSNLFFGWGGEDDDLYTRISNKFDGKMRRVAAEIGRIYTHSHVQEAPNPERGSILKKRNQLQVQGLSTLKYTVKSVYMSKLFTKITVHYDRSDYKVD